VDSGKALGCGDLDAQPSLTGRVRTVRTARPQTAPVVTLDPAETRGRMAASAYAACITVLFVLVGWTVRIIPSQRRIGSS
jgi:hypothetical protein